jgi:hypothetical protein
MGESSLPQFQAPRCEVCHVPTTGALRVATVTTIDGDGLLGLRVCHAACLPVLTRRLSERLVAVLESAPDVEEADDATCS